MKILSKTLIRISEEEAVQSGAVTYRELMRRAGNAAAREIMKRYDTAGRRVAVVCGAGNNGGDGCVLAGILAEHGAEVTVITPLGPPKTEQARYYYDTLRFVACQSEAKLDGFDLIIDAFFGIGLNRPLESTAAEWVEKMNRAVSQKIAIDIPSGLDADSGKVAGAVFKADFTVTFLALKPCFVLPDASEYTGQTVIADIGIPPMGYEYLTVEPPVFEKRKKNSHKGTYGTGIALCGSYGMAGAAILSARAALRSGIGILKTVLCESVYPPFTAAVPEAVCLPVKQSAAGTFTEDMELSFLKTADAVLFGCGCGCNAEIKNLLKRIIRTVEVPLIIDADGINAIADCIGIITECKAPVILTPHPGEMARLCSTTATQIQSDRIGYARDFATKYGCILLLKGANTVIASPRGEVTVNMNGNPGMAKGGSGDVLAGILLALLAQGFSPIDAAGAAAYLHGKAGDNAAARLGERAMLPSDMITELSTE